MLAWFLCRGLLLGAEEDAATTAVCGAVGAPAGALCLQITHDAG